MRQEQPPQILRRKGVAMDLIRPWRLLPAFGAPSPSLPCELALRQRWLYNKETMTPLKRKTEHR